MRKVELLPTRDYEAGYDPDPYQKISMFCGLSQNYQHLFEK